MGHGSRKMTHFLLRRLEIIHFAGQAKRQPVGPAENVNVPAPIGAAVAVWSRFILFLAL